MNQPIVEVTYEEAMKRFKYLYKMEKLPALPVAGATWFANDGSCAALVAASKDKARINLIQEAQDRGFKVIESFAKDPKWYLANGFEVIRVTKWGVTVVSRSLLY